MENLRKTLLATACLSLLGMGNVQAETIVKNADIVIIGAGASGTAATMAAAEKGAKIILLEKQGVVGESVCGTCFRQQICRYH